MNKARRWFLIGMVAAWLMVAGIYISLAIKTSETIQQTRSYKAYDQDQAGGEHLNGKTNKSEAYRYTEEETPYPSTVPVADKTDSTSEVLNKFHIISKISHNQSPNTAPQPPQRTSSKATKAELPQQIHLLPNLSGIALQVEPRAPTITSQSSNPRTTSEGYEYPAWFSSSWPRTSVSGLDDVFVGDQPLFPRCKTKHRFEGFPFEEPRELIPRSKNPCWYENPEEQRGLRCAPYFYLAGVAKGGTTDMYRRIRLHPDVMQGTMKEYHWWDRDRFEHLSKEEFPKDDVPVKGGVPLRGYLDRVTGDGLKEVAADLSRGGTSQKIFGDGSPSYLWDSFYWIVLDSNQGCLEPRVVLGQHIRHFNPDAKIILSFRHPTPRLYSRFLSRIPRKNDLKGATSKDFHRFVVRGVQLYRACFESWSIRHCSYNHTTYQDAYVRLVSGFYPVFLQDWLRIWPKEQMLILRYEDYAKDMRGVLQQMFDFLELAPLTEEQMANVTAAEKANAGTDQYQTVGKMLPETKAILDTFYEPFIHKLAEMLKDDRFLWLDSSH